MKKLRISDCGTFVEFVGFEVDDGWGGKAGDCILARNGEVLQVDNEANCLAALYDSHQMHDGFADGELLVVEPQGWKFRVRGVHVCKEEGR